MLRLFGLLVLVLVGASGILFLDFNRSVQEAKAADQPPPSIQSYLEAVPERVVTLAGSSQASVPDLSLADMLPHAPEGWTARPPTEDDIAGFLPKKGAKGDPASVELVKAAGSSRVEKGSEVAILAYEKGERRIVIRLARLPDGIFTGAGAIDRRYELQMQAAELRGRPFLTVRGLDVTEEFLGDGMRARFFSASVGAQIEIRMLASKRLKDADLIPFFETLNVKAMNESVVDRQPGLGELPVLVLGSALDDAELAVYEADRSARAADAIRLAGELRSVARAEAAGAARADGGNAAAAAEPKPGLTSDCQAEKGGVKRCSVSPGG